MQPSRVIWIATMVIVALGLALTRAAGPTLEPFIEKAYSLTTAMCPAPPNPTLGSVESSFATHVPQPGLAALVEIEGRLFQVLVGRGERGETWSAAVSGEE